MLGAAVFPLEADDAGEDDADPAAAQIAAAADAEPFLPSGGREPRRLREGCD